MDLTQWAQDIVELSASSLAPPSPVAPTATAAAEAALGPAAGDANNPLLSATSGAVPSCDAASGWCVQPDKQPIAHPPDTFKPDPASQLDDLGIFTLPDIDGPGGKWQLGGGKMDEPTAVDPLPTATLPTPDQPKNEWWKPKDPDTTPPQLITPTDPTLPPLAPGAKSPLDELMLGAAASAYSDPKIPAPPLPSPSSPPLDFGPFAPPPDYVLPMPKHPDPPTGHMPPPITVDPALLHPVPPPSLLVPGD